MARGLRPEGRYGGRVHLLVAASLSAAGWGRFAQMTKDDTETGVARSAELAMPADSGAAFMVVLHLEPTRESRLSSIPARHRSMPVVGIADGMHVP